MLALATQRVLDRVLGFPDDEDEMPVYIWTEHTASATSTRLVEVHCAKCDCTYFYELTREGAGSEVSAYFLFQQRARESAVAKAREDAKRRLASEAELVPCPSCHWINEELIEGYRRTRYRGWIERSIWMAVFGLGFCALQVSVRAGIPGHTGEVILFAGVVPVFLILAVTGVFLLVRTMRNHIQPNARYPEPPRLPRRVPESLMLDAESRQLVPASNMVRRTGTGSTGSTNA